MVGVPNGLDPNLGGYNYGVFAGYPNKLTPYDAAVKVLDVNGFWF